MSGALTRHNENEHEDLTVSHEGIMMERFMNEGWSKVEVLLGAESLNRR